jgi:hypothetical protein
MRTMMFIASVFRLRDNSGDYLFPCRSAPRHRLT